VTLASGSVSPWAVGSDTTDWSRVAVAVAIMAVLVAAAYLGMWLGWRRRAGRHDLPELVPVPPEAAQASGPSTPTGGMAADAYYFGTTVAGQWLDRVVARGLGRRSPARLVLSAAGLDVLRPTGDFRIPAAALRSARHDQGIAGKVVPPHGVLVVTWRHGDLSLDTGLRLQPDPAAAGSVTETHNAWIRAIEAIAPTPEESRP
jgi:hypothetical protein